MSPDSDVAKSVVAKSVVVGVDGSEGSFEALIWATHHAQRTGLPVQVITITEIPAVYTAAGVPALPLGSTFDDLVLQGVDVNNRAIDDALAFDLGITVSGHRCRRYPGRQFGRGDAARRCPRGVGHLAEDPHDRRARLGRDRCRAPHPRSGHRGPWPGRPRRSPQPDRRRHRRVRRVETGARLGL